MRSCFSHRISMKYYAYIISFSKVKSEMGQENNAFSNLDERSTQDSQNKSNKVELYKIKSWRQDES